MINKLALAHRLSTETLFVHPDLATQAERLLAMLGKYDLDGESLEQMALLPTSALAEGRPYRLTEDGMAVIPVHGYLAHRVNAHYPGGMTGYGYISALLSHALEDPDVRGIALDVNSHGGEVAGCFEMADEIRAARDVKPVWAIVDNNAHSAAYMLASAASRIILPRAGSAGSIGVVTMHVDISEALSKFGVKVTMLYAGKYKVDGNPYESLSDEAKTRIEARLESSYNLFVQAVSDNRSMNPSDVRGTEAATFQGEEARSVGLVDAVMSPREAYAAFRKELVGSHAANGGDGMTIKQNGAAPEQPVPDTQQNADSATKDVAAAERARIKAITGSDEAKGREDLASYLAFETEMSVEQAQAILAKAPMEQQEPEKPSAAATPFDAAMDATGNPEVGANVPQDEAQDEDPAARLLASYSAATGRTFG